MLYENNINKSIMECGKIVESLQCNIRPLSYSLLDLLCFYSKVCGSNKKPENKLHLLR